MKRGWRIFLRILSLGLAGGAKAAKKPGVREALEQGGDFIGQVEEIEDKPTPPQTPRAKHRGLK